MNYIINGIIMAVGIFLASSLEKLQFYGQEGAAACIVVVALIGLLYNFIRDFD